MTDLASIQDDLRRGADLSDSDWGAVFVALSHAFEVAPREPRRYRDALYATIVAISDEDYAEARYQLRTARQYEIVMEEGPTG